MPKLIVWLTFVSATCVWAQEPSSKSKTDEPGIQDNSFLIEEAYNQEFGVVQHISNFQRDWDAHTWTFTFTQEWPVDPSPRNQLSYTIPVVHDPASGTGIGDVALNYRFQWIGNGDAK